MSELACRASASGSFAIKTQEKYQRYQEYSEVKQVASVETRFLSLISAVLPPAGLTEKAEP